MKKYFFLGMLLGLCTLTTSLVHADNDRIVVDEYTFPAVLSTALRQGISVPVYLKYNEDQHLLDKKSEQKIANATILYKNDHLYVKNIDFNNYEQTTNISIELTKQLESLDKMLDQGLQVDVSNNSSLKLDLESLYLELLVDKNALETKYITRTDILGEATSNEISSILNYRFGYSYNEYNERTNSSNYLSLDTISSYKEHHLNINAAIYGAGTGSTKTDVYRAIYERDFSGYRFAAGMMDTWSMQSIASFSALNTSKVYGFSYGNKSNTTINDNKQSITPIVVFLASAGTVQIYRDGRLLSIQNFSMGSHELDTSTFPYGTYNVEVKTIINGQEATKVSQVNKSVNINFNNSDQLDWQGFAGLLEYYKSDKKNADYDIHKKDTWLMGAAFAKNYAALSGLNIRTTFYGFDNNAVAEAQGALFLNRQTNFSIQTMIASDGSYLASTGLNYNLPQGYGSIWGAFNKSERGDKLYFIPNQGYDVGLSLNLKQIYRPLGFLNTSYNKDLRRDYSNLHIEYFQNIFNNRYFDANIRTGIQKSTYENQKSENDKYIFLDFNLPISKWFSAGVSSRNSNLIATASYKQNFNDNIIQSTGIDLNQVVKRKNSFSNQDDFSASGFLSYQTNMNSGSFSGSTSRNSQNFNYTTQGAIASSDFDIGFGKANQSSGILIKTGLPSDTKMSALINGQDYTLKGNRNFIPLAPYKKYTVELRNDKNSLDSVSIGQGRHNSVVLYPGNVAKIKPEIKQMVTIFGRIRYPNGDIASNTPLNNHIGKTITDINGEFSLDIDKKYPVITLIKDNGDLCESELSLHDKKGVAWLGEVSCIYKAASKNKDNFEVRHHE